MFERLKRSYYRWKAYVLGRRDVVHEYEADDLVHRFLPESHPRAKARYIRVFPSIAARKHLMRVPKSETIEYFLYEHGGESAQEVHMSLLHATLHELTHWAISEKANDELGSNHSAKWAVEIEKVIRHVNGTCLLDKQVGKIEVTFEEPDD